MIRVALQTQSLEVARMRRDALAEADDLYWASLSGGDRVPGAETVAELKRKVAARRYRAATQRAMARGFVYAPASELAELTDLAELLSRIRIVDAKDVGKPSEVERAEAEALLGGVRPLTTFVTQAQVPTGRTSRQSSNTCDCLL